MPRGHLATCAAAVCICKMMLLSGVPGSGAGAAVRAGQHRGAEADSPAGAVSDGAPNRLPHSARAIGATGCRPHSGE